MHLRLVGENAHRGHFGASVLSARVTSGGAGGHLVLRPSRRPVTVPAEDGRRRRPPAGPALKAVEKPLTAGLAANPGGSERQGLNQRPPRHYGQYARLGS
jgi:hypothetical protein